MHLGVDFVDELRTFTDMDELTQNQPCSCELCQPHWHLGDSGESFVVEAPKSAKELAKEHEAKLAKIGITVVVPLEAALN